MRRGNIRRRQCEEKRQCGEGSEKHPENILSKDELLDNVMMYWLTNSATSSARLYWVLSKV